MSDRQTPWGLVAGIGGAFLVVVAVLAHLAGWTLQVSAALEAPETIEEVRDHYRAHVESSQTIHEDQKGALRAILKGQAREHCVREQEALGAPPLLAYRRCEDRHPHHDLDVEQH